MMRSDSCALEALLLMHLWPLLMPWLLSANLSLLVLHLSWKIRGPSETHLAASLVHDVSDRPSALAFCALVLAARESMLRPSLLCAASVAS